MTAITTEQSKPGFFNGLREEVNSYFTDNNLDRIDEAALKRKAFICYALWGLSYAAFLTVGYFYSWYALLLVLPLIFSLQCIVLSVMHDGSHGSFSHNKKLNKLAAFSLGFAGGSSLIWYRSHVRAHHDNTNVMNHDQDFESGGVLRLHHAHPVKKAYKYQHLYAWFLYLGFAIRWIIWDDVADLITNRCKFNSEQRKKLFLEIIIIKSWHLSVFFIIPALVIGWKIALIAYLIHWMVFSISILMVFTMAHLTGSQDMPAVKGSHSDWALHQLATTADFATGNRALSWVIGGLNFQVEHHIFPKISHTRYPAIQKIVKNYCLKNNVTYLEYPTFRSVLYSHFKHLKNMGRPASTLR